MVFTKKEMDPEYKVILHKKLHLKLFFITVQTSNYQCECKMTLSLTAHLGGGDPSFPLI